MSSFEQWAEKLDFAFVAVDKDGSVGVFYVDGRLDAVPDQIRLGCSEKDYSDLTEYLIDDLERTGRGLVVHWYKHNPYDSERGLFMYRFDKGRNGFVRVATPEVRRAIEDLVFPPDAASCILRRDDVSFQVAEFVTF
jgi:hypothetical protein